MKRIKTFISAIMLMLLIAGLSGCSQKEKRIDGKYPLQYVFTNGYNGTSDIAGQYLKIKNTDNNIHAELYLTLNNKYSLCSGYLSEDYKGNDYIKYKFWIDYVDGSMFEFSKLPAIFDIYFFPDSDRCELRLQENFIYKFAKNK